MRTLKTQKDAAALEIYRVVFFLFFVFFVPFVVSLREEDI